MTSTPETIAAEMRVRERMVASDFTVAELVGVALEHGASPKDAQRVVDRVVQAGRRSNNIRRNNRGRWGWYEGPTRSEPAEEESEWERYAEAEGREFAEEAMYESERAERLVAAERTTMPAGLRLVRKSTYHFHIVRGARVVAQWWPSTGTTMQGERKGPRCRTPTALVTWLQGQAA